ncbi:MAG TPA: hypothetical protein VGX23_24645 [Actinocrinis sp.]|nr:hypothetical protein [Actinocrinis sp.]
MSAEPSNEPGDIDDPAAESLWARLFAGWFLLAGGLLGLAAPFAVSGGSWAYRSVVLDLDFAAADGSLVVIGVLLLLNRARSLTVGMAVGFTAVSVVRNLDVFRTDFSHLLPAVDHFPLGRFFATVLGGICLTGITWTTRAARRAVPHDQVRGARIAAMVVGAVGGVCWFVGDCLAWNTTTVTLRPRPIRLPPPLPRRPSATARPPADRGGRREVPRLHLGGSREAGAPRDNFTSGWDQAGGMPDTPLVWHARTHYVACARHRRKICGHYLGRNRQQAQRASFSHNGRTFIDTGNVYFSRALC